MAAVYVRSGAGGAATGADWANAYLTLAAALTAKAAGDVFYISEDHAETQASAMTMTSPGTVSNPCFAYCVNHAGSVPPVSADLATTATITTTGANAMTMAGVLYVYGVTFSVGSGAVSSGFAVGTGVTWSLKNCKMVKAGTTANAFAYNISGTLLLDNTTLQFGHTADRVTVGTGAKMVWLRTTSAIAGATIPISLLNTNSGVGEYFYAEGVDFSAMGSGKTIVPALNINTATIQFKDCKLGASVTIAATPTAPGFKVQASRTDSTGTNYTTYSNGYEGIAIDETVIVRTGGASDGTTPRSMKITTTANAKWAFPFEAPAIAIWNDSTAAATATIEGIMNAAALPNNDDVWFDLEYLGSSATPLGSFVTGTKADGLATGSALTASTQAWDSLATARANSTAYALGDVRKVASNTGRLFFCTTAGTSAGSEPAGYASAVDGGSVTDGSAVFRAGMRFKQTLSFTAGMKGYVYGYVKGAKASTTWYVDPMLTLA
jgi:hypothetical protein